MRSSLIPNLIGLRSQSRDGGHGHELLAIATRACLILFAAAASGRAQMPGVPVLQNAFATRGVSVAANVGTSDAGTTLAAAMAWAPASERFIVSGGLGVFRPETGSTSGAYGLRLAIPVKVSAGGGLGVAGFVGVGGAAQDTTSFVRVPIGAGVGYRRSLGGERGISAFVTPFFAWSRASVSGTRAERDNGFGASLGVDLALARVFGITIGYEFGRSRDSSSLGSASNVFGAGLTYVFR